MCGCVFPNKEGLGEMGGKVEENQGGGGEGERAAEGRNEPISGEGGK